MTRYVYADCSNYALRVERSDTDLEEACAATYYDTDLPKDQIPEACWVPILEFDTNDELDFELALRDALERDRDARIEMGELVR